MPFSPCWLPLKTKKPPAWRRSESRGPPWPVRDAGGGAGAGKHPSAGPSRRRPDRDQRHRPSQTGRLLCRLPLCAVQWVCPFVGELCGWFYHFKNTSPEPVGDDSLVAWMRYAFDHRCMGQPELLQRGGNVAWAGPTTAIPPSPAGSTIEKRRASDPKIRTGEGLPAARLSPPAYLLPGPAGRAGPAPGTPQAGGGCATSNGADSSPPRRRPENRGAAAAATPGAPPRRRARSRNRPSEPGPDMGGIKGPALQHERPAPGAVDSDEPFERRLHGTVVPPDILDQAVLRYAGVIVPIVHPRIGSNGSAACRTSPTSSVDRQGPTAHRAHRGGGRGLPRHGAAADHEHLSHRFPSFFPNDPLSIPHSRPVGKPATGGLQHDIKGAGLWIP